MVAVSNPVAVIFILPENIKKPFSGVFRKYKLGKLIRNGISYERQESLYRWLKKILTGLFAAVDNLTLLIKVLMS